MGDRSRYSKAEGCLALRRCSPLPGATRHGYHACGLCWILTRLEQDSDLRRLTSDVDFSFPDRLALVHLVGHQDPPQEHKRRLEGGVGAAILKKNYRSKRLDVVIEHSPIQLE